MGRKRSNINYFKDTDDSDDSDSMSVNDSDDLDSDDSDPVKGSRNKSKILLAQESDKESGIGDDESGSGDSKYAHENDDAGSDAETVYDNDYSLASFKDLFDDELEDSWKKSKILLVQKSDKESGSGDEESGVVIVSMYMRMMTPALRLRLCTMTTIALRWEETSLMMSLRTHGRNPRSC